MFWDKPKTTWNKLKYILVAYWHQPPSIKKILDPPLYIAPHFSESAGSPVRIRHCLRRQLASHSSFQYSVNCPSSPSYWPAHLPVKQKYIWLYYGGPQLSRHNQKPHGKNKIPHGKTKNLKAKTKYLTAKPKTSRQNQILHSKNKIALVLPWVFAFAVSYLVFAVKYLVLPWALWFSREVLVLSGSILFLTWGFWFCHEVFLSFGSINGNCAQLLPWFQ